MQILGHCDNSFELSSCFAFLPTEPPIRWVPAALSLGVKWPGREADHTPPSSDEIKNVWSYISTPQYAFVLWCSVKAKWKLHLILPYLI
jgi:hypothetical protein